MQKYSHSESLIKVRASLIYTFLTKLKQRAKDEQAVIFYEGIPIDADSVIAEQNYCAVKHADNVTITIFSIPNADELLYSTVKELQVWLKSCFKLYKEIKV